MGDGGPPHRAPLASDPWPDFDDLIAANREFAADFDLGGFDGVAHAGVAIVTCMDSRIDPLRMLGLSHGDAKIFRNPGGRVTAAALEALVLGVHLLGVERILVDPAHPLRDGPEHRAGAAPGRRQVGGPGRHLAVLPRRRGPDRRLQEDVQRIRSHPLIPDTVKIGGFLYDVDTGLIDQKF